MPHPSASFSATVRVRIEDRPGSFGRLAAAVGATGASLGAIDLVSAERTTKVRDVTVLAADAAQLAVVVESMRAVDGTDVLAVSDRTFQLHEGGKIEVVAKTPIKTREDLSMVYTPGVARVSQAIADDREKAWTLTTKQNMVAVVTDGSAVLGLGDIGPEAALPVMEGKAMLFKDFAGVDAFPLCLATNDIEEIVATVKAVAPGFGGINLEDIAAPRCFAIEQRLRDELDIPVFHDDQHGTAIVVLAALVNALRVVGKKLEDVRIVTTGCGAAGTAVTKILLSAGAKRIVGCDEDGALYAGRPGLSPAKAEYARLTNAEGESGTADEMLEGADVFIGVSVPGAVTRTGIARMAPDAIVFTLANPRPEIDPEEIEDLATVIATGRSDYPNQINNVLAFPGVFRGALDVRASAITKEMELAAAHALAEVIPPEQLSADYIVPSVFDRSVAPLIAAAVAESAVAAGVARVGAEGRHTTPQGETP
ncbi:MAG: malic enzyme-like NAD(P)-binding protein [Gaiellaceae bacterium]